MVICNISGAATDSHGRIWSNSGVTSASDDSVCPLKPVRDKHQSVALQRTIFTDLTKILDYRSSPKARRAPENSQGCLTENQAASAVHRSAPRHMIFRRRIRCGSYEGDCPWPWRQEHCSC